MLKIYELIGDIKCVEIIVSISPIRKIERLEGWIGAHIRNMLLAATNEVECVGYKSFMDRINHFPIEDSKHPWYKELKGGFPKGYVIKILSPKQRSYEINIEHSEPIIFSVTLIGSFAEHTREMIKAIDIFAKRGILCEMEHVIKSVSQHSMLELIYKKKESLLMEIDFITPLSVIKSNVASANSLQNKMNGFISIYQLTIAAANRLAKMAVLHSSCKSSTTELSEAIEEIAVVASGATLKRCNLRHVALSSLKRRTTKDAMIFDGLVGRTEWSGDVAQLYPLLKFCSYISLGENVVYGMGHMEVM